MSDIQRVKTLIEESENEALSSYLRECEHHSKMARKGDFESVAWIKKLISTSAKDPDLRASLPACVIQLVFDNYQEIKNVDGEIHSDAPNTEQKIERRRISRNDFISVNEAVQYVAKITNSTLSFASDLLSSSKIMDAIGVFRLDFLLGVATDSTPIYEEDSCDVWNRTNDVISAFQNMDVYREQNHNFSNKIINEIEMYGWERKPFFDFIRQLLQRLAGGLGTQYEQVQVKLGYLDPEHPRYAPKLAAAIKVWEAMEDENLLKGKGTVAAMKSWLEPRYKELGLIHKGKINNTAIQEVAKVANWNEDGGAPSTPES